MITPTPLRPAVAGGFTLDDVAIDEQAGTVTCPGGHTRQMSATRTVTFGTVCADCPLRACCVGDHRGADAHRLQRDQAEGLTGRGHDDGGSALT